MATGGAPARPIPRDRAPDATLALLRDGYRFIGRRCDRLGSDVFETRLMLEQVVCMRGPEAVRLFYEGDRLTRRGAIPPSTLLLLQGIGSVQMLDDRDHRIRKRMFMELMTPESIQRLVDLFGQAWRARRSAWGRMPRVVLVPELRLLLCRAVCAWAGLRLDERDLERRTEEFGAMIEGAGSIGPRNWWGMLLRSRTELWARRTIEDARAGRIPVPDGSALAAVASHPDADGRPLDPAIAAVELINLLRPTVAVERFITFAALALHHYPEARARVETGDDEYLELFVQEVRRFYPFFAFVGARARDDLTWRGHRFARGTWLLLDLYGTDHHPDVWGDPELFRPERFRGWSDDPFALVPQGGGNHHTGHRCPGESITIALVKEAVRLLTGAMRYDVPPQDLTVDLNRFPAIPRSRFAIANVRADG